ncbi:hypothetical protein GF406_04775 [candidate division KSB1 bacterium]|nr:hypothetical protein [candidate division KSB1 bacterium]
MKSRKFLYLLVSAVLFMAACDKEDNPVDPHDDEHNEAEGVQLLINTAPVVVVREGKVQSGAVAAPTGGQSPVYTIQFLDHDGDVISEFEAASSASIEIANPDIATAAFVQGQKWQFTIQGLQAGATTMVIKLLHGDHADFTTPAIPVVVGG